MPPSDMEVRITGKVGNLGKMEDMLRAQGLSLAAPRTPQQQRATDSPPAPQSSSSSPSSVGGVQRPRAEHSDPSLTTSPQKNQQPVAFLSPHQLEQPASFVSTSPHKVEQPAPVTFIPSPHKSEQPVLVPAASSPGAFNGINGMQPVVVTRAAQPEAINGVRQQPVRVLLVLTRQDGQQQQQQTSPDTRAWQHVKAQPQQYTAASPQRQVGRWDYSPANGGSYNSPQPRSRVAGSDGFNPFATPFVPQGSSMDDAAGLPLVPVSA